MVTGLRVMAVGNLTGLMTQNFGLTRPFGINQDFDKILP
jgi:hypothetical protein